MFEKSTAIQDLPFYKYLTDEQKDIVLDDSEIVVCKKGEVITGLINPV